MFNQVAESRSIHNNNISCSSSLSLTGRIGKLHIIAYDEEADYFMTFAVCTERKTFQDFY